MTAVGEQIVNGFVTTLNERDFDGFEALFVDDYQQHQALATSTGSPAAKHAVRTYYQDRITAFPDMVVTAQPYLATDDYVAVNFVYRGTHQGTYLGLAPTGRGVIFNSTDIMRLRGDRLAEHWGTVDQHGHRAARELLARLVPDGIRRRRAVQRPETDAAGHRGRGRQSPGLDQQHEHRQQRFH